MTKEYLQQLKEGLFNKMNPVIKRSGIDLMSKSIEDVDKLFQFQYGKSPSKRDLLEIFKAATRKYK
jgi:hypothetical protein